MSFAVYYYQVTISENPLESLFTQVISYFGEGLVTFVYMCKSSHKFFQISESLSSLCPSCRRVAANCR